MLSYDLCQHFVAVITATSLTHKSGQATEITDISP